MEEGRRGEDARKERTKEGWMEGRKGERRTEKEKERGGWLSR